MYQPFNCPECGGTLDYTHFDAGGQHWRCLVCGRTDAGLIVTYSTGTGTADKIAALKADNARLRVNIDDLNRAREDANERASAAEIEAKGLTAELDAAKRRAEAAIADLRRDCTTCEYKGHSGLSAPCLNCQGCGYASWEWRGPGEGGKP